MIDPVQRETLRNLAKQIAEIAAGDENERIKKRWRDVNALRKPDRAPVWCNPVGAWGEILPEEALTCTDPWLRSIERGFRMILFKHDVGDDTPVDPCYRIGASFDRVPENVWGLDIGKHSPNVKGGAWAYDPPLKTEADFDKLRMPIYTYNPTKTEQSLSQADDLLGDILPVKLACSSPLSATLGTDAADLRGLGQMMMDMIDRPDLMHRLMAYLRDCNLRAMDQVAAAGLLSENNVGPMFCSDPIPSDGPGYHTSDADGPGYDTPDHLRGPDHQGVGWANMWGGANSQEFDQVSPAMWEEFCLGYQKPILARYGLAQYGCCESLTHKIDGVLTIPNLRIFVCSAWTDLDKVIERVGRGYTIMWRQKASEVVFAEDVNVLKRGLEDGMRRLQGCYYQVVLRELQTLAGHPDRLHVWARLAMDAAERYA